MLTILTNRTLDVSQHQSKFELSKIVAQGIKFIIMRATIGTTRDARFESFAKEIIQWNNDPKNKTVFIGFYHVLSPQTAINDQLDTLIGVLKQLNNWITDLSQRSFHFLPVLDIEQVHPYKNLPSFSQVEQFITGFLKATETLYGIDYRPIIYSNPSNADTVFGDNPQKELAGLAISKHHLWLAHYSNKLFQIPEMLKVNIDSVVRAPKAWIGKAPVLWQYSDGKNGPQPYNIAGCENDQGFCDRNVFLGALQEQIDFWQNNACLVSPLRTNQSALSTGKIPTTFFAPSTAVSRDCIQTLPNDTTSYNVEDIRAFYQRGVRVLMSKATEGESVQKDQYRLRAESVLQYNEKYPDNPMLWAASHTLRVTESSTPENQAKNFINVISRVMVSTLLVVEIANIRDQIQTVDEVRCFLEELKSQLPFTLCLIKGNPDHLNKVFIEKPPTKKSHFSIDLPINLWIDHFSKKQMPTFPTVAFQALIWEYTPNRSRFFTHSPSTPDQSLEFLSSAACHSHFSNVHISLKR